MKSKWFAVLSIAFLCLQIVALQALLGCEAAGGHALIDEDEEGDTVNRSKNRTTPPTSTVSSQADTVPDMHITEWLYTEGEYTSLPGGGIPYSPTVQTDGYIGVKVPHPFPTYTAKIVSTGAYSPTAVLYFRDFPTNERYTIPLEYRGDLVPKVESKYPSGSDAHWEVWWSKQGYTWPQMPNSFKAPEVQIDYYFDFGGTPCWGCTFDYLLCIGDICAGPFQERIVSWGGQGALVDFHPNPAEVVVPGERFTKTHELCNHDQITHTYDLSYSSSRERAYTFYTREQGGTSLPATTIQLGVNYPNSCKYVELASTTSETDTVDTVLITATSTLSPTDERARATTFNLVFTPEVTPTVTAGKPQLSIDKSAPSQVLPGSLLTYTIMVSEAGIEDASGVQVTDTVPANTTCYTPTIGQGGTLVTDTVVWSGLNISRGQNISLTFAAVVGRVPSGTIITNDAYRVATSTQGVATNLGRVVSTTVTVGAEAVYLPAVMKTYNP